MSLVYRCELCDGNAKWTVERRGDVATSWGCTDHIEAVMERMQRDFEVTKLTVWMHEKAVEWADIADQLSAISSEGGSDE